MNNYIKERLRILLDAVGLTASRRYYSQIGEDAVLRVLLSDKVNSNRIRRIFNRDSMRHGFYIDVGAFSPRRLSNTFYFYKLGWHGIAIEPNPILKSIFKAARPRDLFIAQAISDKSKPMYYVSNGYSGANYVTDVKPTIGKGYCITEVLARPLSQILDEHLPKGTHIDFMSVDCEGHDLTVLQSNDWGKYRPRFVLAEVDCDGIEELLRLDLLQYMTQQNYLAVSWTVATVIFRDRLYAT